MNKKIFFYFGIAFIIFILLGPAWSFIKYYVNDFGFFTKQERISKDSKEYVNLFELDKKGKLKGWYEDSFKNQHAFIGYYFNNYVVLIQKIHLTRKDSLDKSVRFIKAKTQKSGDVYSGFSGTSFKFCHSHVHDSAVKDILIACDKNLIQKVEVGDSIICYNVVMTSLSLYFDQNKYADIMFENGIANIYEKSPKDIYMNVVLYKKRQELYQIFVYPQEKGRFMDTNIILNALGINSH